jgi:Apea-like HEPN
LEGAGEHRESDLLAGLELSCARACTIAESSGIPKRKIRKLGRDDGELVERDELKIDWEAFSQELSEAGEMTEVLWKAVDRLEEGSLVDVLLGGQTREQRAGEFWSYVLVPILQCYGTERPDWEWDAALARELTAKWIAEQKSRSGDFRTIAPLRYFDGPDEALPIGDGLVIRPFTDRDREELWREYEQMRGDSLGTLALDSWSHVVDYNWKRPMDSPPGHDIGIEAVEDVVLALRLHHPGTVRSTMIWTRLDPPTDPFTSPYYQVFLYGPAADHNGEAMREIWNETLDEERPTRTRIEAGDGEQIGELLRQVRAGRSDRSLALALRRFSSAYARYEDEDSLIDLWIAFEALLLSDDNSELKYRVSLRIAALVGTGPDDREAVFKQAKNSYNDRSRVVHGGTIKRSLTDVVEETRELARSVLRRWILEPPKDGVNGVDRMLLEGKPD